MYLYVYLVMNIIIFFHLINGVQLLYGLLKVVLQAGQEVSLLGPAGLQVVRVVVPEGGEAGVAEVDFLLSNLFLELQHDGT